MKEQNDNYFLSDNIHNQNKKFQKSKLAKLKFSKQQKAKSHQTFSFFWNYKSSEFLGAYTKKEERSYKCLEKFASLRDEKR